MVGHLHSLWHFTLRNAWRDANLEPWGDDGIAHAARWTGDHAVFCSALREVKFLDQYVVHSFIERAGKLINDRRYNEQRRVDAVKRRKPASVRRKAEATVHNLTVPDLTVPDPTITPAPKKLGFEEIWNRYPKRLGRKEAEKHFKATVITEVDFESMVQALGNYKRYIHDKKIEEQFIKMGSSWFNNWRDWVEYTGEKNGTNGGPGVFEYTAIAEHARKAMGVREPITPPRSISSGIRDLPDIPLEAKTVNGNGKRGDVDALEILRTGGFKIKPAGS